MVFQTTAYIVSDKMNKIMKKMEELKKCSTIGDVVVTDTLPAAACGEVWVDNQHPMANRPHIKTF